MMNMRSPNQSEKQVFFNWNDCRSIRTRAVDDVELINLLAELGIIILVFVVGLEFRLQKLRKAGIKPIVVGMSELLIMFFLAYVGAFSFG